MSGYSTCEGFPPAGRAAVREPGPALPEASELLFDERDQLVIDRVPVRPEVGRVDGVRVIVVRIRVLDLDDDEARHLRTDPLFVECVRILLLCPVVAVEFETIAVVGLQVRVRRLFAKPTERAWKVTVVDYEREAGVRVRVEPVRQ